MEEKPNLQKLYDEAVLKAKDSVIVNGAGHPDTILAIQQVRLLTDQLADFYKEKGTPANHGANYTLSKSGKPVTRKEVYQVIFKLAVYALAFYGLYKIIRLFF